MSLLAMVVVELREDDERSRRTATEQLARLGLHPRLAGLKGVVPLPRGAYAGVFPGPATPAASEALQQRLIDDVSDLLLLAEVRANVLVTVSAAWSWHYRPVPRRPQVDPRAETAVDAPAPALSRDRNGRRDGARPSG